MDEPDFTLRHDPKTGLWVTPTPKTCPAGHPWRIGRPSTHTLSYAQCRHDHGGSGHTRYSCQTEGCDGAWWNPPLEAGCTVR